MRVHIQWLQPAIPTTQQGEVEKLALSLMRKAEFLSGDRRALSLKFLPDLLPNLPLLAIIEELRSGKLLGAMQSQRSAIKFILTQAL